MGMNVIPSKFEAYDEIGPVFMLTLVDECCAEVIISTPVTVESWKEISAEVLKCLEQMKLEV